VTKCCIGVGVCIAGVISSVLLLGQEAPLPEIISPAVVIQEERQEQQENQTESIQMEWEIRTVADMIGEDEASALEGFVEHVGSPEEWQDFVQRIGVEEHERASEHRATYVMYILEKQNKRLILAEHDKRDGEVQVMYLFGDRDEPIEKMARIILEFRNR